jgi:hypothetical protein
MTARRLPPTIIARKAAVWSNTPVATLPDSPRAFLLTLSARRPTACDALCTDASLFPRCAEIYPSLTVMALADRIAERLCREWPDLKARVS